MVCPLVPRLCPVARASIRPGRITAGLAALATGLVLSGTASHANDPHDRYFQGLRERRLFSVAENYCLRRLSEPGLSSAVRAGLTIELSRTLAEHAAHRTGQEQDELWRQSRDVIENLLAAHPDNPRAVELEFQSANVLALRGAALRWRVELAPYDDHARDQALLQMQSAIGLLQDVESRVREQLSQVQEPAPAEQVDRALTRAELRELARDVQYRLAVAWLDLARVLPSGLERTAALHEANGRFIELSRSRSTEDTSQLSRLYRAEIARRQNDAPAATGLLDALERDSPGLADEVAAERVRLKLDQDRADQALQLLVDFLDAHGALTNELAALNVEALLKARDAALARNESGLAAELLHRAEQMDATIGAPWRAHSRTLLEAAGDRARYGVELADVIRAARSAYQNGDVDRAAEQYSIAVAQARESSQGALAVELQLTRASILLQSGRFTAAAAGFESVAAEAEDAGQAGDAHLLYAYCLGKQWEQQPASDRRAAYIAALEDHRARFASRSSASEATWMLASVLDAGNEWQAAIEMYGELPPEHARAEQARARVAALYVRQLEHLRETGQPTSECEDRAVEKLLGFLDDFPVPPARLNRLHAETAVQFARILLDHRTPRYDDADALLQRVQQSHDVAVREAEQDTQPMDPAWSELSRTATRLQIVALAGQQRTAEARQLLNRLSQTGPGELLTMLSGLADISRNADEQVRRELADLQIQAADRLMEQRDRLDEASRWLLDETRAEAYEARRRPHDALLVYNAMLEQQPQNKRLVRKCAQLLASTGDPRELQQAYDYWKRLVGLEQQGERGWLEARYELAACSLQLGEVEEARKLVGVTKLLYPELGGADLRQRYSELESRIAAAG